MEAKPNDWYIHNHMITFDEFKNVELKVATVLSAERVEKSHKLLRLHIDLGEEKRQLVAGIGTAYEPDALVGRQIIIVANLEPRELMGLESQGMLLAANAETPVLLMPESKVPPGTSIR